MRLVRNWRSVLMRAWSIRLILLAALLSGAEVAVALVDATMLGLPPGTFAALAGVVSMAAFVARLLAQQDVEGD